MDTLSRWVYRGLLAWIVCGGVYFETVSPILGQSVEEYRLGDHERRITSIEKLLSEIAVATAVQTEKTQKLEWMNATILVAVVVQIVGRLSDKVKTRNTPRRRATD